MKQLTGQMANERAVQFMYVLVFVLSRFMRSAFMGYVPGVRTRGTRGIGGPGRTVSEDRGSRRRAAALPGPRRPDPGSLPKLLALSTISCGFP